MLGWIIYGFVAVIVIGITMAVSGYKTGTEWGFYLGLVITIVAFLLGLSYIWTGVINP